MSVVAAIRPDAWNFPLFVHVLGAMILVGGLVASAAVIGYARGDVKHLRFGYWSLLAVAFPGWVLMRVGGQWIYSREGWDDLPEQIGEPAWLELGWLIGDLGGLILVISLITGGVGLYRLREGKGAGPLKATLVLSVILLVAYVVAVWAMSAKPS